ncbi:hypothetical protein [Thioclava sp. GXIMD4216]|uniref:hypothetical protein n=1 Tax=Thioclava sp. GXIMD4216 TaxID=3131929 RepID=UPI0030D1B620
MANLILLHKPNSVYDDRIEEIYDFPKTYLKTMKQGVGQGFIYYEPLSAGQRGYFALGEIWDIVSHPEKADRFIAHIKANSLRMFSRPVPRLLGGKPLESALAGPDGRPKMGGAVQRAVRAIPADEFRKIVDLGKPV